MQRALFSPSDVLKETTTSVSTSAPQDISPFCDTSLKPPVREKMLPEEKAASSTPSMPEKEKVGDLSVISCISFRSLQTPPGKDDFFLHCKILSWKGGFIQGFFSAVLLFLSCCIAEHAWESCFD